MGLGVLQGKNVAEMRAAVLTRRRCGFDTRPPHHRRVWSTCRTRNPSCIVCVAARKDGRGERPPWRLLGRRRERRSSNTADKRQKWPKT